MRALAAANFAIALICILAWIWFRQDEPGLQIARFVGFIVALGVGIALVAGYVAQSMLWTSVVILYLLMALFHAIRIKGPRKTLPRRLWLQHRRWRK